MEAALRRDPGVLECAVLARDAETGPQLVAYVVFAGPFRPERLRAHLQAILPPEMVPAAFVPLARLPLTSAGGVDESALARLEVIDADLIHRWEAKLTEVPEIGRVAVVVEELSETLPLLHLSDLLPAGAPPRPLAAQATPGQEPAAFPRPANGEGQKPAISRGGPLRPAPDAPATLGEALERAALGAPDQRIVYLRADGSEIVRSHRELWQEARRIAAGLRRLGLKPQDPVLFQLDQNQDFVPAFWGCAGWPGAGAGLHPAHLSTGQQHRRPALSCLLNAGRADPADQHRAGAGRASLAAVFPALERLRVVTLDELRAEEPATGRHLGQADDLALLLLTSGSTGTPKAVMLTQRNLLGMIAGTIQMNGFSSRDVSLNWMAPDHVGAIVPHIVMPVYLRCAQVHAPTRAVLEDPLRWLDWIDRYRVSIAWAPNFAYALINSCAERMARRQWDLSSLHFLINAGEAIVARAARRFLQLLQEYGLPGTAMRPAFGMSETCSGLTWGDSFSLDATSDDLRFVEAGPSDPGRRSPHRGRSGPGRAGRERRPAAGAGRLGHCRLLPQRS